MNFGVSSCIRHFLALGRATDCASRCRCLGQHLSLLWGDSNNPFQPSNLQEYVRARLIQFAMPFGRRVAPALPPNLLEQAAAQTIAMLPPAEYGPASVENRDLQLVFRHDCL